MLKNYFQEKITLIISFLILNNYFLLVFNFSELIIKINFFLFLVSLTLFYFYEFNKNLYLKIFFLLIVLISLGTPTFEWDPRSIWLFHGKRIFYDNSIFSIVFSSNILFNKNSDSSKFPILIKRLTKNDCTSTSVSIEIYDISGNKVIQLLDNNTFSAGNHKIKWDASNISGGIYFYRLTANNFIKTNKMILLK